MEASVNTNLEVLEAEVLKLASPVDRSHLLERLIVAVPGQEAIAPASSKTSPMTYTPSGRWDAPSARPL